MANWREYDGSCYNAWARPYTRAGGWGTAEVIDNGSITWIGNPVVSFDSSGKAVAIWDQNDDGTRADIWMNTLD